MALAMFAGVTLSASADTLSIDGSGFQDATITKGTVYYWHKGLPPTEVDGTSYPVIVSWDNKYFLKTGSKFYGELTGDNKAKYAKDMISPQPTETDDPMDIGLKHFVDRWPAGFYHKDRAYTGTPVSELPFDFSVLKNTGSAVSLGAPDLPRFVAVGPLSNYGDEHGVFARKYNNDQYVVANSKGAQYAIWFPDPYTGLTTTEAKYWLTGTHRIYSVYKELQTSTLFNTTKAHYLNSLDWYLDYIKDSQNTFLDPEKMYRPVHYGFSKNYDGTVYEARPPLNDLEARTWYVSPIVTDKDNFRQKGPDDAEETGQYHIMKMKDGVDAYLTSFYAPSNRTALINYVTKYMQVRIPITLMHSGDYALSVGGDGGIVYEDWISSATSLDIIDMMKEVIQGGIFTRDDRWEDRETFQNAKAGFDLYWGEPATISFCQVDFSVQKGQVQTFDGPIAIGHDVVVTVEDGGVLSCSDWILNNGTIIVKPGGTLLLQTYETKNEQIRYGTIASLREGSGDDGGRILCDGNIIVMPDCKLCCSGKYGLQLGEGAQVVNYGAIISENLSAASSYTIENRGNDSRVFAGWGLKDCGSTLLTERITGEKFSEKSTKEKAAVVNLPSNAVYGKGASRLYVNTAGTVSRTSVATGKTVTDDVARLPKKADGGYDGYVPGGFPSVRSFTLPAKYGITVFYPDSKQHIYGMRDTDVTFMIHADPKESSFLFYEYQMSNGEWTQQKEILDVSRPVQIYIGYYNDDHHVHQEKLIFEGLLIEWDGSDGGYFEPPEQGGSTEPEKTPLIDVVLSATHNIQVQGGTNTRYCLYSKSRVMIYEDGSSVYLEYSNAVDDYIAKDTLTAEDRIKVYHTYTDESFAIYQDLIYEGLAKDWVPTLIQ